MYTQAEVFQWCIDVYGAVAYDKRERVMRVIEETVELAQAEGVNIGDIMRVCYRTYARPPGDTPTEVADIVLTLMSLAENAHIDIDKEATRVMDECLSKPPEYYQEKYAAKVKAGIAARL